MRVTPQLAGSLGLDPREHRQSEETRVETVLCISGFCYATGKDAQPGDIIAGEAWRVRQWIHSGFVRHLTAEELALHQEQSVRDRLEQAAESASQEADRTAAAEKAAGERFKAAEAEISAADAALKAAVGDEARDDAKTRLTAALGAAEDAEADHISAKRSAADAAKLAKAAAKAAKD